MDWMRVRSETWISGCAMETQTQKHKMSGKNIFFIGLLKAGKIQKCHWICETNGPRRHYWSMGGIILYPFSESNGIFLSDDYLLSCGGFQFQQYFAL